MPRISADRILYEDDHLLAVNKRSGELVVRGRGAVGKLPLLDLLRQHYPGLRAVHRLDFDTSGVLLFARTQQVAQRIKEQHFLGWEKAYRTLVAGCIARDTGVIRAPLPARTGGEVSALTRYRVLARFAVGTYIEAVIETGRQHQIRRHFASIGHPLLLDHLYGDHRLNAMFTRTFGYHRFFLHASSLAFLHPITGERVRVEAAMPRVFEQVLAALCA